MLRSVLFLFLVCTATRALAQTTDVPAEVSAATLEYCKAHDFSPFLLTNEKFGATGVFDQSYGRLQIHFETVERDATNPLRYNVTGASRHMKTVTPFKGRIMITDVKRRNGSLNDMLQLLPGEKGEEESRVTDDGESGPYVLVSGTYNLREDSTKKFSGVFSGTTTFALREEPDGQLSLNWNRTSSNYYRNFVYSGTWTTFDEKMSAPATWADGRIPVPEGIDVGTRDFTIAPKYEKGGWKKDADGNYLDNPEYWWRADR